MGSTRETPRTKASPLFIRVSRQNKHLERSMTTFLHLQMMGSLVLFWLPTSNFSRTGPTRPLPPPTSKPPPMPTSPTLLLLTPPPPPPPHSSEDSPATQIVWFYMGVPSTTSWVGVGFNTKPTMKGADMIVGSMGMYEGGGSRFAVIADRNTPDTEGGNTMPIVDAQEDVKLIGGYIYQGWLVMEFYRMVDTMDRAEDIRLDEATYLLWATGGDDTMINDWGMGSFPFHSRYGCERG